MDNIFHFIKHMYKTEGLLEFHDSNASLKQIREWIDNYIPGRAIRFSANTPSKTGVPTFKGNIRSFTHMSSDPHAYTIFMVGGNQYLKLPDMKVVGDLVLFDIYDLCDKIAGDDDDIITLRTPERLIALTAVKQTVNKETEEKTSKETPL